jgi:DNA-binding beta-propeller fold protein YncE
MSRRSRSRYLGALMLALLGATVWQAPAQAQSAVSYHLASTVPLGAPTQWDYVVYSPTTHRVFVAHGNRLDVVDAGTGSVVGHVGPIPGGPHGVAFDPATGVGITDDGRSGEAVIFSLRTLRIVKRLKVQPGADAVTFDPVSGHAFVIDGRTGTVAVIDPAHARVVSLIRIGGDLEYAVPGDNGKLYVNGVTHHEIFRIDTATNRVDATWPMSSCAEPSGLAIDTATHRLFSSCRNQHLVVVNAQDGAVVATLPIGPGTDADRFDPRNQLIFSSNGANGTLSVIREVSANSFVPVATVRTELSARTMAIDPATGQVFVVAAHTTPQALNRFFAAFRSGKRPKGSPFTPGSFHLLIYSPGS